MSRQFPRLSAEVWHTYLLLNRFVSVAELRTATGLPEAAIGQHLATLREQGLIDQEDRGGTTVYRRTSASSPDVQSEPPAAPAEEQPGHAPVLAVTDRAAPPDIAAGADRSRASPAAPASPAVLFADGDPAPEPPAVPAKNAVRRAVLSLLAAIGLVLVIALVWSQTADRADRSGTATGEDPTVAGSDPTAPTTPGDGDPEATPTGDPEDTPTTPGDGTLQLEFSSYSGEPFETVPIQGTYVGAEPGTSLRVQRQADGTWVSFPLRAVTDEDGNFSTFVELGPGRYRLRVTDVAEDVVSEVFLLRIA
uniref:HTH arsR-type domain-containing protein n=1 Tax=uncultured Nocardioidaceae bacterium TaxID=253824 RepID=A0A6J4LN38_9ACTN|nr:MAG: hypothetical protein AVDCRST_MAG46-1713 [uncultured Nocardioidaceae bacterium]